MTMLLLGLWIGFGLGCAGAGYVFLTSIITSDIRDQRGHRNLATPQEFLARMLKP